MNDETTGISDRAELSVFVKYIDSDSHKVCKEFLVLVQIIGSKGAEGLFNKIKDFFLEKELDLEQM